MNNQDVRHGDAREWCAGLPLVQRRPLQADELRILRLQALRLFLQGIAIPAGCAVLLAACFRAVSAAMEDSAWPSAVVVPLIIGTVFLVLAGPPISLILAYDRIRRAVHVRRDLRAGFVKHFVGTVDLDAYEEETLLALWKAGLISPQAPQCWIEVLPGSRRVWKVQGEIVKGWILAPSREVADTPEYAAIAAQWVEPFSPSRDGRVPVGHREMSAQEIDELRRYARRLWPRLVPAAAFFTLLVLGRLALHAFTPEASRAAPSSWSALSVIAALWFDYRLVMGVINARRLLRAAQIGRVLIFRLERGPQNDEDGAPTAPGEVSAEVTTDPFTVELLPVSRWVWTEDGRAAGWRRTAST